MTRVLERLIEERGRPENVRSDNGPEFTSRRMLGWAEDWKVGLVHIQPGRPMQNGHVESFHGRLRDECLNAHWFRTLNDVRSTLASWRREYNCEAPAQLTRLQDAGRVPAKCRLCKCGKQRALPTFTQPRRLLRDNLGAKPKPGNSGYKWFRNRGPGLVPMPSLRPQYRQDGLGWGRVDGDSLTAPIRSAIRAASHPLERPLPLYRHRARQG